MKAALIGGTNSGCGKTTVILALLQYLKANQHRITSFKTGPDFLDPSWHQAVTGAACYNLDPMMMDEPELSRILGQDHLAEVALIEGVMGLFDARDGIGKQGSGADLAHRLSLPVLLVVDAKGMSGSIAPLVKGFVDYGKAQNLQITGVIANKVGSENHADLLTKYLEEEGLPPLVAWMDKHAPSIPERHLGLVAPEGHLGSVALEGQHGLVTPEESIPDWKPHLHILEGFWNSLGEVQKQKKTNPQGEALLKGKRIAVAKDQALSFIYPANLDWLKAEGAEVCFFSICKGEGLPEDIDALWLPGGYPELKAEELSSSKSWGSILPFIESGGHCLAECGGMMALGEFLLDHQGKAHAMAGLLPFETTMQDRLAALGYREVESGVKGHEFHHSKRKMNVDADLPPAFLLAKGDQGMRYKNLKASYVHWYFSSASSQVAQWFGYLPK